MEIIDRNKIADFIGHESHSDWLTITQEQIDEFADCTLDHQFIHVDPERAKETPFGSTIAHGFLTLSMLSHLAEGFVVLIDGFYMGMNYGFDKVRFIAPVKVNSRIRALARVMDITEKKPGYYMFRTAVTIEIENEEKPALIVEWLTVQMVA